MLLWVAMSVVAMTAPDDDAERAGARQLETFLAAALSDEGVEVVSHDDLEKLLGLAAEREVLGCGTDWSCLGDVAGSLDVGFLVTGRLSRAGEDLTLVLVLLDTKTGGSVDRAIVSGADVGELLARLDPSAKALAASMSGRAPPRALVSGVQVDPGVLRPVPVVDVAVDDRAPRAAELARVLAQSLTAALAARPGVEVVGRADLLRTLEGERATEACLADEGCLADVAGALDAERVVLARVAALDEVPVVTLTVVDGSGVGVRQRLVRRAATLEDVDDVLAALAARARLPAGRVLVSRVEVDPAVFPIEGPFSLSPVPLTLLLLATGVGTAGVLGCVPGLNCVAFPLVPGIGALLQVYLGNTLGQRRARLFLPMTVGYLVWFSMFGALPILMLAFTGLQNLLGIGAGGPDPFHNPIGFAFTFLTPLAFLAFAALASQLAVTAAFALGARHPVSDVDELGIDFGLAPPAAASPSARTAMAY